MTGRGGARAARGGAAHARGLAAERRAEVVLARAGFAVLGRRIRTGVGEIDLVARRGALTIIVEVKARPRAEDAAFAIPPRQRARLIAAAEALMAAEPAWFGEETRFDAMLVGADGELRWLAGAFRADE